MEYQGFPTTDQLVAQQTSEPQMLRALLYGAAAGAVAGAIWFAIVSLTHRELGLVAVAVGWLVGQAVVLGSGGKRGINLQLLSVAVTLAAMAGAEYFIVRSLVVAYVADQAGAAQAATIPLFLPLDIAFEFVTSAIQDDPAQLIFWAIALFAAFRVPAVVRVALPKPAPTPT